MNKQDVIEFFDKSASSWDDSQERNEEVIVKILHLGGIKKGADLLDVACGTGVLFPDYIKLQTASVTGIDISSEMVRIAKEKFPQAEVVCGDAEAYEFRKKFDAVMIYNAFPHFVNPDKLIENLAQSIKTGGRLSVAHGAGKEEIDKCHSGSARNISLSLPEAEETAKIFEPHFNVDVIISDSSMYMVSGTKK